MDPVNQGMNLDASLIFPAKRKRGRPRKDPSEKKQPRRARPQVACLPPGFGLLNSNGPPQVAQINNATENMIGRTVTGVVEATFDAGYLLAVKIGNSNTTLRGVVFKPGHSAPVTAENDVVPHIPMIRRNEIYFSTESQAPPRRRKRRSRENNMQLVTYMGNETPLANQMPTSSPSKGNYVLAPSVPPVGARGTVVPVVLQPKSLSNGLSNNQPAPHLRALQGKPVHTVQPLAAVYPLNESTNQVFGSQTSSQVTPDLQHSEGAKLMKSSDVRPQGGTSANQDRDDRQGSETADMEEPLFVEPLQTRHHFQPAPPVARAAEHIGAGRMSELLQAVQQNMGDAQVPRNGHPTAGSM